MRKFITAIPRKWKNYRRRKKTLKNSCRLSGKNLRRKLQRHAKNWKRKPKIVKKNR